MTGQGEKLAEHTPLVQFALKMEENWRTLTLKHKDERAWAKLPKAELEEMHTKIAGWIQECERELAARPSPKGKNNIIDEWKEGLTRKNGEIQVVIDNKKRAVT